MMKLGEHFERKGQSHQSDWLKQQRWFIKSRQDQKQRDDAANKTEDGILATAVEVVIATQIQMQIFEAQLDEYDESIVAALMENQILLNEIERRLAKVEADLSPLFNNPNANNVMDDGRRIFLTADRNQAYDEFGKEVSNDEYDYGNFNDDFVAVDPYISDLKKRGDLIRLKTEALEAREGIHAFEDRVNEARQEAENGEMTEERLDELSAELDDLMPPEVGELMSDYELPSKMISLKSEFAAPARPLLDRAANMPVIVPQNVQ